MAVPKASKKLPFVNKEIFSGALPLSSFRLLIDTLTMLDVDVNVDISTAGYWSCMTRDSTNVSLFRVECNKGFFTAITTVPVHNHTAVIGAKVLKGMKFVGKPATTMVAVTVTQIDETRYLFNFICGNREYAYTSIDPDFAKIYKVSTIPNCVPLADAVETTVNLKELAAAIKLVKVISDKATIGVMEVADCKWQFRVNNGHGLTYGSHPSYKPSSNELDVSDCVNTYDTELMIGENLLNSPTVFSQATPCIYSTFSVDVILLPLGILAKYFDRIVLCFGIDRPIKFESPDGAVSGFSLLCLAAPCIEAD